MAVMAKKFKAKKKNKTGPKPKLTRDDPTFFAQIGARGGFANRENHDANHFRRLAIISHQVRRERTAARKAQEQADSI